MAVKWKLRDGKWRRINVDFEEQRNKTLLLNQLIVKINQMDDNLTADQKAKYQIEDQAKLINDLLGLPAWQMEELLAIARKGTGPELAESIRACISVHRATNRSVKDKID